MERINNLRNQLADLLDAEPATPDEWAEVCIIEKRLADAVQEWVESGQIEVAHDA